MGSLEVPREVPREDPVREFGAIVRNASIRAVPCFCWASIRAVPCVSWAANNSALSSSAFCAAAAAFCATAAAFAAA